MNKSRYILKSIFDLLIIVSPIIMVLGSFVGFLFVFYIIYLPNLFFGFFDKMK
jgi:hypothetical protein